MEIFQLDGHDYVELCDLLKLQGWTESGASAKSVIAEGLVSVDGVAETRKRCKIADGKVVTFGEFSVRVSK
ncbi:ribosome-associated protein YbcJ [Proteus sp. FME41]|uniref:ribosome-associated protein YbcJ n=1 Tax=Proteus sp. FME41 TaxID=2742608 RepID=UPI001868FC24|nr:ribosome-associated protein YbcJ [Proteus sp. FME41]